MKTQQRFERDSYQQWKSDLSDKKSDSHRVSLHDSKEIDKHRQRLKNATSTVSIGQGNTFRSRLSLSPEEDNQIKDYLTKYD